MNDHKRKNKSFCVICKRDFWKNFKIIIRNHHITMNQKEISGCSIHTVPRSVLRVCSDLWNDVPLYNLMIISLLYKSQKSIEHQTTAFFYSDSSTNSKSGQSSLRILLRISIIVFLSKLRLTKKPSLISSAGSMLYFLFL